MKYKEAVNYLLEQLPMFQRVGAAAYRADLGNISALCNILDNPQKNLRCIHVGGTNGKGSVTHIIASILQAQGYRVGVFTSPHYLDYRERIKINGRFITKRFITDFVGHNLEQFKEVNASFFEITTAMAFQYFKEEKVDFAIIEVGMGGRLDSTNIITPVLSVITNISLDHQQFLGNTLPLIAAEKAGIIKLGIPIVIGETQHETKSVFKKKAKELKAPIYFADQLIQLENFKTSVISTTFYIAGTKYQTDVHGEYQKKNITTALCAITTLASTGVKIKPNAVKKGLKDISKSTYLIGRYMLVDAAPTVLLDSAHNEGGIKELMAQIKTLSFKKLHLVYGTVADKDLNAILSLLPSEATYYLCKPNIPRGKEVAALLSETTAKGLNGTTYKSVKSAYKAAKQAASKNDLVLVCGSIFVVAEVL